MHTSYSLRQIVEIDNETLIDAAKYSFEKFGMNYLDTQNLVYEIMNRISLGKLKII